MLRMMDSRSLHYAPPDFLWNFVALVHFMRFGHLVPKCWDLVSLYFFVSRERASRM